MNKKWISKIDPKLSCGSLNWISIITPHKCHMKTFLLMWLPILQSHKNHVTSILFNYWLKLTPELFCTNGSAEKLSASSDETQLKIRATGAYGRKPTYIID